jgi:hypothetical protein
MAAPYTDAEITELLAERKPLPDDYLKGLKMPDKRVHREAELEINSQQGSERRLIRRQTTLNVFDFSILLGFSPPESGIARRI